MKGNRFDRYQIESIEQSSCDSKTFSLKAGGRYHEPEPGQYFMVWLPGVSENAISASGKSAITVRELRLPDGRPKPDERSYAGKDVDSFSHVMMGLNEGDYLLMRGPKGNGFNIHGDADACVIAAGCGIAPMRFLVNEMRSNRILKPDRVTGIIAARNADVTLFADEMAEKMDGPIVCTDDGSLGRKGVVADVIDELDVGEWTNVYMCGPEVMMPEVARLLVEGKGVLPENIQILLENYMKCGDGLCGACPRPLGQRLCKDGPVLTYDFLMDDPDFGRYTHDVRGARVPLKGAKIDETRL